MKSKLILLLLILTNLRVSAQSDNIMGPLPYRTLQETIGENYRVIILDNSDNRYSALKKIENGQEINVTGDHEGLIIKLMDIKNNKGFFKDSVGTNYIINIGDDGFYDVAPVSEINNSKKFLLNKMLWLRDGSMAKSKETGNYKWIELGNYAPVKVINVSPSTQAYRPVTLTLKAANGEIGYLDVNLSGTNASQLKDNWFYTHYLLEDPRVKYHVSPLVWKKIVAGDVAIGMTTDEVRLIKGSPYKINTTTTKAGTTEQYVYGEENPSYYYFTKDKLTAIQR